MICTFPAFAPPDWNTTVSLFTPDGLLTLQMLLLDAGLLLSLYIAWRILQQSSGGGFSHHFVDGAVGNGSRRALCSGCLDPASADANAKHGARLKLLRLILLLVLQCGVAHADGGHVRLQQTSGDLVITLFTAPEPLVTGKADFSVMVQDRSTQQLLPDASITLELHSPSGVVESFHFAKGDATNRMLQAVTVHLPVAGDWSAKLNVQSGANQALLLYPVPCDGESLPAAHRAHTCDSSICDCSALLHPSV